MGTGKRQKRIAEGGDGFSKVSKSENFLMIDLFWFVLKYGSLLLGICLTAYSGYFFVSFVHQRHEAIFYFSAIKQVEREISFRTESGLYYSYYKQLVLAPSFLQGIQNLVNEKVTEHPDTINILQRMNIYQEIIFAFLYRFTPFNYFHPMYFYIYSALFLNGLLVAGIFASSWYLTQNLFAGCLSAVMYFDNIDHTSRLITGQSLRENHSLPFLYMEMFFISVFLAKGTTSWQKVSFVLVCVCSFFFSLFWQFNQFIFLLQSLSLVAVNLIGFVPDEKTLKLLVAKAACLLATAVLQFGNRMLITSLAVCVCVGGCVTILLRSQLIAKYPSLLKSAAKRFFCVVLQGIVFILTSILTSVALKVIFPHKADTHIFRFVMMKLGYGYDDDFDVRMYNCAGAFVWLPYSTYYDLMASYLFQPYVAVHTLLFILCVAGFSRYIFITNNNEKENLQSENLSIIDEILYNFAQRPELAFHAVQCTIFGILSITTIRMKYFWVPYMCILMPLLFGDGRPWKWLFSKFKFQVPYFAVSWSHLLTLCLLVTAYNKAYKEKMPALSNLGEFWDPDTVELMDWITNTTRPDEAFTGSMQLLAGVKCCTERHITNHPHYEDDLLRQKTRTLYQIYGRKSPKEIFDILKTFETNYIILEDSICLRKSDGCRTSDLIDNYNGELTDSQMERGEVIPGLKESRSSRFCDQIRHHHSPDGSEYAKYFRLVLHNRTFRVYKLLY